MVRKETLKAILTASARNFKRQMRAAKEHTEDMTRQLAEAGGAAAEMAVASDRTEEEVEDLGDEASQTSAKVSALTASLQTYAAGLAETKGAQEALDLGDVDADADQLDDIARRIGNIPNAVLEMADTFKELTLTMDQMGDGAKSAVAGLEEIDGVTVDMIDDAIKQASTFRELTLSMNSMGEGGEKAAKQLDDLPDSMKDIIAGSLEGSASLRQMENRIDETGDETKELVADIQALDTQLSDLIAKELETSASTRTLENRIDELGDEMRETTVSSALLSTAMGAVSESSNLAAVNIGPFTTGLGTALKIVVPLIPAMFALGTAILGVVTAFGLLFGGISAIALGGLLSELRRMEEQMAGVNNMMEAMQEMASRLADAAERAIAPLMQPAFQDFALDILEGSLDLLNWMARSIAAVSDELMAMADTIAASFWDQTPEFFAQLEQMVADTGPIIVDMMQWFAHAIPDFIGIMRTELEKMGPTLGLLVNQIIDLFTTLATSGSSLVAKFGPFLAVVIAFVDAVLTVISGLLSVFDPLTPAFQGIAEDLIWVIELVDRLVGFLSDLGRLVVDVGGKFLESAANMVPFVDEASRVAESIGLIGDAIGYLANIVKEAITGGIAGAIVGGVLGAFVGSVGGPFGAAAGAVGGAKLGAGISAGKAALEPAIGSGEGGSGPGVQSRAERLRRGDTYNFDFRNAQIGSATSKRGLEQAIERALKRENATSSDT